MNQRLADYFSFEEIPDPVYPSLRAEEWYRLTEREHDKTPLNKKLVGTVSYCKRAIVRVGYRFQPRDYRPDYDYLRKKMLVQLNRNCRLCNVDPLTEDQLHMVERQQARGNTRAFYQQMIYEESLHWCQRSFDAFPLDRDIRTFYYMDPTQTPDWREGDPTAYKIAIDDYKFFWNGQRYDGHAPSNSWEGEYEGDPPSFASWIQQGVYMVSLLEMGFVHPVGMDIRYYVHPLDLLPEDQWPKQI